MAKVRGYNFTTGIETSTIPDPGTPSAANDSISLGYLEDQSYWGASVADYAALRALTTTERKNEQTRRVEATAEQWYYDASSTATDDGATILEPDDNPVSGRWLIGTAGGGGGGAGGSGIETLMQKLELEKQDILTEDLDNSVGVSAQTPLRQNDFKATLLKGQSASDTSVELVWNAEAVNQSDQNMDSTTGYTATGAGASLTASTTAGDFQVGSAGLKFDKNGTSTEAAIRYDTGTQTRQFAGKSRVWMYVKLPSVTQLSNVLLRIYADSTSNFQTFTNTTDFAGNALAIGWNLLMFDISTGGSAGGTGWDITKLCRYIEMGVTTSSSGQTYTGIIFDSVYFSHFNADEIGAIGTEYTLFNNSTKEDIVIAASNTRGDGRLTLVSALANSYSGGLSGTARARVQRSTIDVSGGSQFPMDNDATFSGAITTTQDIRFSTYARDTIAGVSYTGLDMVGIMVYKITAVGGSTIDVSDPANFSANMVNGDTFDFFRPVYTGGKLMYKFIKNAALTASSSHSSGTTTLTVVPTSLAVGDYACRRHVASHSISVVAESAAESFTSASIQSDPDGIQLIDAGIDYPRRGNLFGHWALGSFSNADATRNRVAGTAGATLSVNGTPNISGTFQRGALALVGPSGAANYLTLTNAQGLAISGNTTLAMHSLWFYFDGASGSNRMVAHRINNGNTSGWSLTIQSSAPTNLIFRVNGTEATGMTVSVGWNHVFVVLNDSGSNYMYLNGVKSTTISATPGDAGDVMSWLVQTGFSYFGSGLRATQHIAWSGGTVMSASEIRSLYNGGYFRPVGPGLMQRYMYATTGASGQKLSFRARVSRTTTGVTPVLWKAGMLVG